MRNTLGRRKNSLTGASFNFGDAGQFRTRSAADVLRQRASDQSERRNRESQRESDDARRRASSCHGHILTHSLWSGVQTAGNCSGDELEDGEPVLRLLCLRHLIVDMICFGRKILRFSILLLAVNATSVVAGQDILPAPPSDRTMIYTLDEANRLMPLPFEAGTTPLKPGVIAKNTQASYIEIKGEHAITTLTSSPRIFLFTTQRNGTHPPFIVWLTPKHGSRRVTAVAQAGLAGFAISSAEIVKPILRVLNKLDGDEVFMELQPRTSLDPGEYAIIGDDLKRIATFRVTTVAMP